MQFNQEVCKNTHEILISFGEYIDGGGNIYYFSLGVFIIMSIMCFVICFIDKDIKKLNCDAPTKFLASLLFGAMIGLIVAICETLANVLVNVFT